MNLCFRLNLRFRSFPKSPQNLTFLMSPQNPKFLKNHLTHLPLKFRLSPMFP
jgi:hypothetical protein